MYNPLSTFTKQVQLSHLVDAIFELGRMHFPLEFEGRENKFYRLSTLLFNIDISRPSIVYIQMVVDGVVIDFVDIRGELTKEIYDENILLLNKIPFEYFTNDLGAGLDKVTV